VTPGGGTPAGGAGAPRRAAVVTDSTSYLPPGLAERDGVTVVPLQVVVDGRAGEEGREVRAEQVARALRARSGSATTSRPAPVALEEAYREAARAAGVDRVVAVHLSSRLSGTVAAARLAAQALAAEGVEVRVVDSRLVAMGLGFSVLAAARVVAEGGDAEAAAAAAERRAARTEVLLYVDTLEHLRRGGRMGRAASLLGTALAVKPLLHVVDGETALLEKVRTVSRALARLEEQAVAATRGGPVELAVHHLAAGERALALATRLRRRVPDLRALHVSEVGAVVGAHTGPGMLGVVISRV